MDEQTAKGLIRNHKIARGHTNGGNRLRDSDVKVFGVARIYVDRIEAVYLKPRCKGFRAFDQTPPRHGFLAWFTAEIAQDSRELGFTTVRDISIRSIEAGADADADATS